MLFSKGDKVQNIHTHKIRTIVEVEAIQNCESAIIVFTLRDAKGKKERWDKESLTKHYTKIKKEEISL